jgi:hypothetical protein
MDIIPWVNPGYASITAMRTPLVAFRSGPLRFRIEAGATPWANRERGGTSAGAIAKRDLAMYYALLAEEMERVELSPDELAVLITVVGQPHPRDVMYLDSGSPENPLGSFNSGEPPRYIEGTVRWQAYDLEGTAAGPARQSLLDKVETWSDFRAQSVMEALTQYTNLADRSQEPWDARVLAQVGLLKRPYPHPSPEVVEAVMDAYRILRTAPEERGLLLPMQGRSASSRSATNARRRH